MVVSHHPLPSILPLLLFSSSPGIPAQRPPSSETSENQGGAGRSYIFAHALSEGSTVFKSWRGKVAVAAAAGGGGGCGNFFAELADHAVHVLPLEQETCLIVSVKKMSVAVPNWR